MSPVESRTLGVQIVWEGLRELLIEAVPVSTHLPVAQAGVASSRGDDGAAQGPWLLAQD